MLRTVSILTFLGLALSAPVPAATYYVDRVNGSDDADGQASNSAWSSLAKVSNSKFQPGDRILLRRGQRWSERLVVPSSGSLDLPLYVGAFGTGNRPILDGTNVTLADDAYGLLTIEGHLNVTVCGLEIRGSARSGVHIYTSSGIRLCDMSLNNNVGNGVLVFDSSQVVIDRSEIFSNSQAPWESFAGIRIDGAGGDWKSFTIQNCKIHHNLGGADWASGNGIALGNTGNNIPFLEQVLIENNQIYNNGNPDQNQAGRGITASAHGDVTVLGNSVMSNASAGIYLGDYGLRLNITIERNYFYNNALRQLGGTTEGWATARYNTILVDTPDITAMGVEIGGLGTWTITNNVFRYTTPTDDTWRGFIRINDSDQEQHLVSDYNLFYSAGPRRWKRSNDQVIDFRTWQKFGFDQHSVAPQ
ncbi:right-handed parallel beta-helix repeat-containing protein [Paludibaculum fermentans]|uniref:Right-handed parallel beta-helix repeat-containing protein n=1 Tax=Paludibaculum fermentans TaxID=1473598 RepID=A0A7S7SNT6_PALFE|nr:right-handed parallel beta-helix repeat-containing protein [Paludibaculum fermentans]QOY90876.1 right-handed parallel beta-helix repeat-containing protein [Paludibaculum fermentans]